MAELQRMMMEIQKKTAQVMEQQEELKEEQKEIKKEVETQEQAMKDAGIYDKANIKLKFDDFQKNAPECYNYSKTFYWTFINYCDALRLASTGVFQNNNDFQENEKASVGVKAA